MIYRQDLENGMWFQRGRGAGDHVLWRVLLADGPIGPSLVIGIAAVGAGIWLASTEPAKR